MVNRMKICLLLCCIWVMFHAGIPIKAQELKIMDQADLLTEEEEEKLQDYFSEIAQRYQCDVAAATTDTFDGKGRQAYTDDFYYENGYGYGADISGIIFMVDMEDRQYQYSTRGRAIEVFTDYGLEVIDEQVISYLKEGQVYEAMRKYGELAEEFLREAESGASYDLNHPYEEKMSSMGKLGISFVIGLAVTVFVMMILFGQLRSVRASSRAQDYIREGSFRITRANDLFLYRTVSRRKIEKSSGRGGGSSTHSTSGGGRAGGRGGSF